MNETRRKRLRNLFLALVIVGVILLVALNARASPPPAPQGGPRAARGLGFVVWAYANGTTNGTTNQTQNHTATDIWNQINLLWGQFNAPGGVWSQISAIAATQFYIVVGLVVLGVGLVVGFVITGRYIRVQIRSIREERVGPEDPNLYAVIEPLLEKTLGPEMGDYFDSKARQDLLRRIRSKSKLPRLPTPGTAGLKRHPGTEDE